nr:FAD-dependent oxidoreductase [Pseudopedobacter sp.]
MLHHKMKPKITILGAGLSGLLIAYRLKKLGFPIQILEARERIGGRISTLISEDTPVEMGATWFGNQHTYLRALLAELKLHHFEQYMSGAAFYEPYATAPPQMVEIPSDAPSYRIQSGTSSLIHALAKDLSAEELQLNQSVISLNFENEKVSIQTNQQIFETAIVTSTLPPALLVNNIQFKPPFEAAFMKIAKSTHTWMQDSIKVALVYATPFWKNRNLSGTIFSNVGPVTEFYDQSNVENTRFALCGFADGNLVQLQKSKRKEIILQHLVKMFGAEASNYLSYEETIWAEEPFTKSELQNEVVIYPHQNNGNPIFSHSHFNHQFYLAGTE